jgi:hypothetical protein
MKQTGKSIIGCLGWFFIAVYFVYGILFAFEAWYFVFIFLMIAWGYIDRKWLGQAKLWAKRREDEAKNGDQ